jgi:hypothetical protein
MTTARRVLAVVGLALAVIVGSSLPAAATWSDTAGLSPMTVATATVAAPGNVVGTLTCGSTATMSVTWTASTAAKISGYKVTVLFSDGFEQTETVAATATSWSSSITTYNVTAYSIRYSVTTQTTSGWFSQSGFTGSFRC